MKFIDKLKKFMHGRYGNDELSSFLVKLYLFLFLFNLLLKTDIITYIELIIFVIIIYRTLSKNIYSRSNENTKFIKIKNKVLKPFKNIKRNIKDKEHIYKKCKHCKTLMKLPVDSTIGIKIARCPKCGKDTKMLVLKRQKVEIISKNK